MRKGSLRSWREGLDAGDLSSEALIRDSLLRMDRLETKLNALTWRNPEWSLELSRRADRRLRKGERSPLLGVPVVLKDNLNWEGQPVSNGSRITKGYIAPFDATVVARLIAAGAIPVAKANMDEFAMGSSGEHSAFGPTRNPWDPQRVPGGSSSGSIAAVSAGYAPFALGTDTGGSVRLPAAFCNVTALRPTYGVLSRYGVTAMASSLDQVGPVAHSADDLALGLSTLVGRDPMDATSLDLPEADRLANLAPGRLKGLRVGLPKEYFGEGLQPGTRTALESALSLFEQQGAELVEVSLPHSSYAIDTYYLLNTAEVSSNLARFDGVRYGDRIPGSSLQALISDTRDHGFGLEAKRRILLGAFCLSRGYYEAFYVKALKARALITQDFTRAFESVDVLATPVSPGVAFPLGARVKDPLAMYLEDIFTVTSALAGLPALALPAGFDQGLPVGIQLVGPALSDARLLAWGHAYQLLSDHHLQSPNLA